MDGVLHDLIVPGVPLAEKIVRPLVVYAFLVVGMRVAGKRELAQLTPFDLVVALTISNTVQNAIIGNDNSLLGGLVGATTLLAANYATVRYLYRHPRLDAVLVGQPLVLIDRGRIVRANLERELITEADLLAVCRRQGVERIEDVEKAILETSGTVSVILRHPTGEERAVAALARRLAAIERLLRRAARTREA